MITTHTYSNHSHMKKKQTCDFISIAKYGSMDWCCVWISFQIFPDAFFHPYVWSNKQTKGKELWKWCKQNNMNHTYLFLGEYSLNIIFKIFKIFFKFLIFKKYYYVKIYVKNFKIYGCNHNNMYHIKCNICF